MEVILDYNLRSIPSIYRLIYFEIANTLSNRISHQTWLSQVKLRGWLLPFGMKSTKEALNPSNSHPN